jgi:hypothetical protein
VEELRHDDPLFVGHVDARIGDAFEERILAPDLIVQDAVAADDLGVDIGEQPVGNVLLLAELAEDLLVIVRDRVELDSGGLELRVRIAQLTELRPARGSPDRRSVEDDDRLRVATTVVIVDEPPVGVRELKVRKPLSDLGAGGVSIREADAAGIPERGGCIEAVMVAFDRHVLFGSPKSQEMLMYWHTVCQLDIRRCLVTTRFLVGLSASLSPCVRALRVR